MRVRVRSSFKFEVHVKVAVNCTVTVNCEGKVRAKARARVYCQFRDLDPRDVKLLMIEFALGSGAPPWVRVRVRVRTCFERRSVDGTRVDGVCDFEKVSPDQLFPSARRD